MNVSVDRILLRRRSSYCAALPAKFAPLPQINEWTATVPGHRTSLMLEKTQKWKALQEGPAD